jgi:hypothetical protein
MMRSCKNPRKSYRYHTHNQCTDASLKLLKLVKYFSKVTLKIKKWSKAFLNFVK